MKNPFAKRRSPSLDKTVIKAGVAPEEVLTIINQILAKYYRHYKSSYHEKIYDVSVWEDGIAKGMAAHGEVLAAMWSEIRENMLLLNRNMCKTIQSFNPEAGVSLSLLNDTNTANSLLTITNGSIVYDVVSATHRLAVK